MGLTHLIATALLLLGTSAAALGQTDPPAEPLPGWITTRLLALDPSDPPAYYLLAEEVADNPQTRREEDLARELFTLACELDRADGSPTWIAPSACLALASMARLDSDARWLRALAERFDPDSAPPRWRGEQRTAIGPAALHTAEAVGEARAGHGIQARDLLEKPGVREIILRYGRLLGFSAASGALWQLEHWAEEWPCRECGGERVVFRPDTDPPTYRECYTCRGNPGPPLTREQLVSQLRFESRLLRGISRSWGAQLAIDHGAPLREPDADELAAVMGVDPAKPLWRDGWTALPREDAEARGATLDTPTPAAETDDPAADTTDQE